MFVVLTLTPNVTLANKTMVNIFAKLQDNIFVAFVQNSLAYY